MRRGREGVYIRRRFHWKKEGWKERVGWWWSWRGGGGGGVVGGGGGEPLTSEGLDCVSVSVSVRRRE